MGTSAGQRKQHKQTDAIDHDVVRPAHQVECELALGPGVRVFDPEREHAAGIAPVTYPARVTDYRRLSAFREFVDVVEAEFAARGMTLKAGAAADLVAERIEMVAGRLGITPRSALDYVSVDVLKDLARNTSRQLKERDAAEDAHPPVSLSSTQAGLIVSAFSVAARLGVVNGDADVAADLCEVITRIGLELRREPPVHAPALLLSKALRWARFSAENLAAGTWTVLPGKTAPDDDQRVATRLHEDLEAIERLLD